MYVMPPHLSKPAVDVHFHVFDAHVAQPGARYVPAYDAPLAAWQAGAAPLGITRGVLVQPSFLDRDHRQLEAALARHPDTLRGVAVLAPDTPAAELARQHALGVRAIRLNLVGTAHDLSAWCGPAAPWPALAALGWHVELHTDRGALPAVLAQLPADLPLVIDHMGKPDTADRHDATVRALAARARHAPVHVTLSGAYRLGGLDAGALARLWLAELGPRALLWGSDWPCTNHETQAHLPALRAALDTWLPDPATRQAVLVDNPARVYWGDGSDMSLSFK